MKIENLIAVITIVAAIFTPIFLSYLTADEVFRSYPEYEVKAKLHFSDTGDFSRLTITNIGSVQAKEVKIHVISDDKIEIKQILCFEADSFNNEEDVLFRIDFTTLSNNIPCKIDFIGQIQIPEIAITSINSPGKYYTTYTETEFPQYEIDLINLDASKFILRDLVLLEVGILIPIYGIIIFKLTRIKKQLESKQKELEVILYNAKSELKIISVYADKDKDIIKNKIRMIELHDKIRNTNRELDEVKSKSTSKIPILYRIKKIGQLFKNWRVIENDLALMVRDINVENTSQPLDKLVQELKNKNKVSDDFVKSFNTAYSGRSKMVHGDAEKSFWWGDNRFIKNQIKIVENLRNMIDSINDLYTK